MIETLFLSINIAIIDLTISRDNAIILGILLKPFPKKERKIILFLRLFFSIILRISLVLFMISLLKFSFIKIIGGIILLFIVYKLIKDLKNGNGGECKENKDVEVKLKHKDFLYLIGIIIITDLSMSIDNIIAVARASSGNYIALFIGLFFSISIMRIFSSIISNNLHRIKYLQYLGIFLMFITGIKLIFS